MTSGWNTEVWFQARTGIFLITTFRTAQHHPVSYSTGTKGYFPRGKTAEA